MRSSVRSRLAPPDAHRLTCANRRPRNITLHSASSFTKDAVCEISDIVKRRSIRAWIMKRVARCASWILGAYLQTVFGARSSQDERVVKRPLLATLDRIAIGSILRSNLVFLIHIRLHDMRSSRARFARNSVQATFCRVCGY